MLVSQSEWLQSLMGGETLCCSCMAYRYHFALISCQSAGSLKSEEPLCATMPVETGLHISSGDVWLCAISSFIGNSVVPLSLLSSLPSIAHDPTNVVILSVFLYKHTLSHYFRYSFVSRLYLLYSGTVEPICQGRNCPVFGEGQN